MLYADTACFGLCRCYFRLGDAALLGAARGRLAAARAALARAHGPRLERLRTLHGNFQPELSTRAPSREHYGALQAEHETHTVIPVAVCPDLCNSRLGCPCLLTGPWVFTHVGTHLTA